MRRPVANGFRTRGHGRWTRRIRSVAESYWLVPGAMIALAIGVAYAMLWVDRTFVSADPLPWLYTGDAAGAHAVLETIAGSMITVAGVVFSITIVALSLASQQFGPLLLRNFMRDRPNQLVLGTFLASFLYCLLILRSVRGGEGFMPHASVTMGIVLAVLSLGVLVFFIHHIASSIRPEGLLSLIARELDGAIERLCEGGGGEPPPRGSALPAELTPAGRVPATEDGYVQDVAGDDLVRLACERDLVVEVLVRPYDFVVRGVPVARVHPPEACDGEVRASVLEAIAIGGDSTASDEIESVLDKLVQLCLRALGSSLNDPITARRGVDRMAAALTRIALRSPIAEHRFDADGTLRLIAQRPTFEALLRRSLDPIRRNARCNADVLEHLLESMAQIANAARTPADRRALRELAQRVERTAAKDLDPSDVAPVRQKAQALAQALGEPSRAPAHV